MVMLIDAREPPGPPPRPDGREPVEPNWPLWCWIASCVGLFALAHGELPHPVGAVLLLLGFYAACKAFDAAVGGSSTGLRDWRQ